MNHTTLSIEELRELDDLDNVNLSQSVFIQHRPGQVPALDINLVNPSEAPKKQLHKIEKNLPADLAQSAELKKSTSHKLLEIKQARLKKIENAIKDRVEKDRKIRKERFVSEPKITLKKVFNIESLFGKAKDESTTKCEEDIIEEKINNRIKESIKILKKAKKIKNLASQSIVHATLTENTRVLEAHLDVCTSDIERLKKSNTTDQYLRTPLHYSAALGNESITSILLQMGADPKVRDYKNRTPLHYAAFNDSSKIVPALIRGLNKQVKVQKTMMSIRNLHTVARVLKFKRTVEDIYSSFSFNTLAFPSVSLNTSLFNSSVESLIEKMNKNGGSSAVQSSSGKFVDWTDDEKQTALHIAVNNDYKLTVQALLDAGCDINTEDMYNKRPLELSRSKYITFLLVHKVKEKLHREEKKQGFNWSSLDNRDLKVLSEEEISKYIKNDSQLNYLMAAVKSNSIDTVKILLNKKAKISAVNSQGWNSLMYALQVNSFQLVKIMLEGSENETSRWKIGIKSWVEEAWKALEAFSKEGWSVIHIAAAYSSAELLSYILDVFKTRESVKDDPDCPEVFKNLSVVSVDKVIDLPCRKKFTPFLLAVKRGRLDIVKVLVACPCDIYVRNGKLQNALHIATTKGFGAIIEYLVFIDADKNLLRTQLDLQNRKPKDLDMFNKLDKSFHHIWDWARLGDCDQIKEAVMTGKFGVNEQTYLKKMTPLHVAVENSRISAIKLLLELGADKKVLNSAGKSPLDLAFLSINGDYINTVSSIFSQFPGSVEPKASLESFESFKLKFVKKKPRFQKALKKHDLSKTEKLDPGINAEHWELINQKLLEKKVSIAFLFDMMDKGHKSALTLNEFQGLLIWLGICLSFEVSAQLFKTADENFNDLLDYHEVIKQLHKITARPRVWAESKSIPKLDLSQGLDYSD